MVLSDWLARLILDPISLSYIRGVGCKPDSLLVSGLADLFSSVRDRVRSTILLVEVPASSVLGELSVRDRMHLRNAD